jgi:hypothetical protein
MGIIQVFYIIILFVFPTVCFAFPSEVWINRTGLQFRLLYPSQGGGVRIHTPQARNQEHLHIRGYFPGRNCRN